MSVVFLATMVIMAIAAIGFVAMPLFRRKRNIALIGAAIAIPIVAVGLYSQLGSPMSDGEHRTGMQAGIGSTATSDVATGEKLGSVASLIDGLAARLEENPNDGKNWMLLARSYNHLNRTAEASKAYARAVALGEFDEQLAALEEGGGPADVGGAQIFGNVRLSDSFKSVVQPTDTVFIFARAVDGPPFPVAVLRRTVADLPLDFLLNDDQAMNSDAKLSNFAKVVVSARISRSGVATDALQGLEAKSEPITIAENRHVELVIE